MTTLHIRHLTTYRYRKPVRFGEHRMMFRPRESFDQRVLSADIAIDPGPSSLRHLQDVFGNTLSIAKFDKPADMLRFESRVVLDHNPSPLVADEDEAISASGAAFPFAYAAEDMPDLLRSIERHYPDPQGSVPAFAKRFLRWNGPTPIAALLTDMTHGIRDGFSYKKRLDGRTQTPAETLERGTGTCRDYAVLMMEAARSLGLSARFVSGYVYSAGGGAAGYRGGGHTHAWAQVYLPSCGWVEFDPTNGIVGNRDLVRVAIARDPVQATPLCGWWDGDADDFKDMDVEVELTDCSATLKAA